MRPIKELLAARRAAPPAPGAAPPPPPPPSAPPCPDCNGARFQRVTADPAHPGFGRAEPCHCALVEDPVERHSRLLQYSRLGDMMRFQFANLDPAGRSPSPADQERYAAAVAAARAFADQPQGWLVITGGPSTGKTHLAAAVARHVVDAGRAALVWRAADLLAEIRLAYRPDANGADLSAFAGRVRTAPLLVIDDVGDYQRTEWANAQMAGLLSARFDGPLPTVLTFAHTPGSTQSDVSGADPRLTARVTDAEHVRHVDLGSPPRRRYLGLGGLSDAAALQRYSFDGFGDRLGEIPPEQSRNLAAVRDAARAWAAAPVGGFVLVGRVGSGKTHLAVAIARARLDAGDRVVVATVTGLLGHLRDTFGDEALRREGRARRRERRRSARARRLGRRTLDRLGRRANLRLDQSALQRPRPHRHHLECHPRRPRRARCLAPARYRPVPGLRDTCARLPPAPAGDALDRSCPPPRRRRPYDCATLGARCRTMPRSASRARPASRPRRSADGRPR